jgi:hypothetical protein
MKKLLLTGLLTLAMGMAAQAVTFDYSSTASGGTIIFDGASHFTFSGGNSFNVVTGSAAGKLGSITGSFTIGAITTSGLINSAPVTGTGTFVIHDGSGFDLSATLVWNDITQIGGAGTLNIFDTANLSGITYLGVNTDLVALKNALKGENILTFQFAPPVSLAALKGPGAGHTTSFSGTVGTPDGGTTVVLLGFALAGMSTLRRTIKGFKA